MTKKQESNRHKYNVLRTIEQTIYPVIKEENDMDDFDMFLAEQMKNERFKKSFLNAKRHYITSGYRMRKNSHIGFYAKQQKRIKELKRMVAAQKCGKQIDISSVKKKTYRKAVLLTKMVI